MRVVFIVMLGVWSGWTQGVAGDVLTLTGSPGPYTVTQWEKHWPGCEYEDGVEEGRVELIKDAAGLWLRALYPTGSHGPDMGGAGWRWPLPGVKRDQPAMTLEYDLRFEDDFDFVKGGKLPGLCGGPKTITGGDPVNGKEGWSARLMWRKDGRGQAYVYHMDQPSKYGDEFDFPKEFQFQRGETYTVKIEVAMNTVGKRDGRLGVWINGTKLVERLDMRWRAVEGIGVESLLFNTFHGGSDASWAPARDCHARFGNFRWSAP